MSQELFSRGEVEALLAAQREEQGKLWASDRLRSFEAEQQVELDRERQHEETELRLRFEAQERERLRRFEALRAQLTARLENVGKSKVDYDLSAYRAERIAELRDPRPQDDHFGILPELIDLIQGSTRAEVDASLATMVAKTRSVVQAVQEAQSSS